MRILCPNCGFGREMDEAKVPARAQMATCPKCAHKFRFRVVDDVEVVPAASNAAPPAEGGTAAGQDAAADPMAAQRAAAAAAWERLGTKPAEKQADASETPEAPARSEAATSEPAAEAKPWTPAADPGAPKSTGSSVPFEDLPKYGFFPGLYETVRQVLTRPTAFFRVMPRGAGMGKPLAFHLLLAECMVVCQYLWSLAGFGATAQYLGSPELMEAGLGMAGAAPILLFIIYPLLLVLRLMLLTGIVHLLLNMIRSGKGGAEATFRVLCYAAAPLVLGVLPLFGPVVGGLWSIGLTVIGLKEAHGTKVAPALFAVLVPILLMLAAVVGLVQGMTQAG